MKITEEEIQEEINQSTKEQDILRRLFKIIQESYWEDYKLIPKYCNSFKIDRSLGKDIGVIVQKNFPKWYTKQIKIHKSKKLTSNNKDCAVTVAEQPSPKPDKSGFAQS